MRNSKASERRTAWGSRCGWCLAVLLAAVIGSGARPAAAQGAPTWAVPYDGGGNDFSFGMAVDANGNVYVTGRSFNGGSDDIATVKYDTNGNQLWVQRYDGPGHGPDSPGAAAMIVDAAGNVYVTGYSWGGGVTGYDYVTLKYDTNGNPAPGWPQRYNGPGIPANDEGQTLAVDTNGNVYVTGRSVRTVGSDSGFQWRWDITTLKYGPGGNLIWEKPYNGTGNGWDTPVGIAVDAARNVYVTGTEWGGDAASWDYVTIKYDTNGTQLWAKPYSAPGNSDDIAQAMAVDANGNACVTGYSSGDLVTLRYDTNGNRVWVQPYPGPGSPIRDFPPAIAVDGAGRVYVTGSSWGGDATGFDYATLKYDTNGTLLWARRYNDSGNSDDRPQAIAVDAGGNVYVSGYPVGGSSSQDYVTLKYDTNGNLVWNRRYDGPGHGPDAGGAIVVDGSGSVYVTGSAWVGGTTGYDFGTLKYAGNQPPAVGPITAPLTPVAVSTTFNTSASFTDPDDLDTHTALWNWGDGTTSAGGVTETSGSGSASGSHSYTSPGVYTITLTVNDNHGGSGQSPPFQYLVAYDPNGGFVTGSGQIQSPAGAYTANPTLAGKASFGFNSKYQPGANVPDGKTQFRFHEGDLDFRSTAYEWLVVAGARAQFKGTGTINGTGSYSFMLTAIDGQVNGGGGADKFRIKIWSGSGVVYDNQMGASDGADPATTLVVGSIVIHKP